MDFSAFKREFAKTYAEMAEAEWFVEQVRHTVRLLRDTYPAEFGDLAQLIADEMNKRKEGT